MMRVLGGRWKRRTGSRPWPDHRAVPNPFMVPETRLPDWYPAWQSLHGSVHTDPDPDPCFLLFFQNPNSGGSSKTSSLLNVILSIVVGIVPTIIFSFMDP